MMDRDRIHRRRVDGQAATATSAVVGGIILVKSSIRSRVDLNG